MGLLSWPIWTCDVSEFDWHYGEKESCLLLEGEVEVETDLETVNFSAGDFVRIAVAGAPFSRRRLFVVPAVAGLSAVVPVPVFLVA